MNQVIWESRREVESDRMVSLSHLNHLNSHPDIELQVLCAIDAEHLAVVPDEDLSRFLFVITRE